MRTRLLGMLAAVALAAAGQLAAAPGASADEGCAGATPFGPGYEMGTVAVEGTLSPTDEVASYVHSTGIVGREITVAAPDGQLVTLAVSRVDCTDSLCTATGAVATCPAVGLPAGDLVVTVEADPARAVAATRFRLVVTGGTPTQCSDGVDNDGDGWSDYGVDPHCTSWMDATESQTRVAAAGHITIETNANNVPTYTTSGVYNDPSKFSCSLSYSPVQVVCNQVFNTEIAYQCTAMILKASVGSTARPTAAGTVRGYSACATGHVETADATVFSPDVEARNGGMGAAAPVVCRANPISGHTTPTGAYWVDCWEPGVAYPFESSPV